MLYTDMAIKLNQYIDSLQEPQRFFMYLLLVAGVPLIITLMIWIANKIENK